MNSLRNWAQALTAGAVLVAGMSAAPVLSAQADLDMLKSYVGNWSGLGSSKTTGQASESVKCNLSVTPGGVPEKINFNGKCALSGGVLSIKGTMAYVGGNSYEAVMSSNTAFTGVAKGRRSGNSLSFNLRDKNADTGDQYSLSAGLGLTGGKINASFTVTNLSTGQKTSASVPFTK